jgi:bifunctional UDP-N-acetylglucosamine pyrophosphorylase/glucosamine-1-phosphate N-acetyltransferase
MSALADFGTTFAVQDEQRGTGHAVMAAREYLEGFEGNVVVLYGDMPLLAEATIRSLIDRRDQTGAAAVALTIELDNPPDFGRIVRDADGRVERVVEVKDCTPEELAIREVNVGAYCFDSQALLDALGELNDDNAQSEYYLTDVFGTMATKGQRTATVVTPNLEEALGINDPVALAFAEKLADIRYAESLYELIDATANAARGSA